MIHTLQLTHFKQHRAAQFDFVPGLNVLQGENAQGKTNVLKGILFALFGTTAAGNSEHLTTWGEDGGMKVVLDVSLPVQGWIRITRSTRSASIHNASGDLLASGLGPVTRFCEDSLGMPYRLFKSMQYAEQGDSQILLRMGASGLQQHLEKVAKVDIIDRILVLMTKELAKSEGMLVPLGNLPNLAALEEQVDALTLRLSVGKTALELRQEQVNQHEIVISELDQQCRKLEHQAKTRAEIISRTETLTRLRQEAEARYHSVMDRPVSLPDQSLEEVREQMKRASDQADAAIKAKTRYDHLLAEKHRLSKELDKWEKIISLSDSVFSPKHTTVRTLIDEQERVQEEASRITAELKSAVCQSCGRAFSDEALAILQLKHREIEARLVDLTASLADNQLDFEKSLQDHSISLHDFTIAAHQYRTIEEMLNSTTQTLSGLGSVASEEDAVKERQRLQLLFSQLSEEHTRYRQWTAELGQVTTAREQLWNEHQAALRALADLPEVESDLSRLLERLSVLRSELNAHKESLSSMRIEQRGVSEQLQALKIAYEQAESQHRLKAETEKAIGELSALLKFIRSYRGKCMTDSWQSLVNYSSYLIGMTTETALSDLIRDDLGEFWITKAGRRVPVDELSGAEKSIVGLCLRLALSRVFYGDSGFLLLDEITADCSEQTAARVSGLLQSLNTQVIMVTHRQGDASNAQHVINL